MRGAFLHAPIRLYNDTLYPDVLSLIELLSGDGCGSSNHSFSYFLLLVDLFIHLLLT